MMKNKHFNSLLLFISVITFSTVLLLDFFLINNFTSYYEVISIADFTDSKYLDMISPFGIYLGLINLKSKNIILSYGLVFISIVLLLSSNFRTSQIAFALPLIVYLLGRLIYFVRTYRININFIYISLFTLISFSIYEYYNNFEVIGRFIKLFDQTESRSLVGRLDNNITLINMLIESKFFIPYGLTSRLIDFNTYEKTNINIFDSSNFFLSSYVGLGFISLPYLYLVFKQIYNSLKVLLIRKDFASLISDCGFVTAFLYLSIFPAPLHSPVIPFFILFFKLSSKSYNKINH